MKIKLETLRKLRKKTQMGILKCQRALEQTKGNIEKAIILLRKENLAEAITKGKEMKIYSEGIVRAAYKKNKAILFELNTETDFVVKNKFFLELCEKIEEILLSIEKTITEKKEFLNYNLNGQTVENIILETASILKENICLKRIKIINKKDEESFGVYNHNNNKISCLIKITQHSPEVEKKLPIHIAGFKPKFISKEKIDPIFLNQIKEQILLDIKKEKKIIPDVIIPKVLEKRLEKILKEICLLENFLYDDKNDPKNKISEYLKLNKTDIIEFIRFEIGEE
jgi:elongation factor Ts